MSVLLLLLDGNEGLWPEPPAPFCGHREVEPADCLQYVSLLSSVSTASQQQDLVLAVDDALSLVRTLIAIEVTEAFGCRQLAYQRFESNLSNIEPNSHSLTTPTRVFLKVCVSLHGRSLRHLKPVFLLTGDQGSRNVVLQSVCRVSVRCCFSTW